MAVGIGRALGVSPDSVAFAEEGRPAAVLARSSVVAASYVDNGNIVGATREVTKLALDGFLDELDRRELIYHEVCQPASRLECGGADFDFQKGTCLPRLKRAWRLYRAIGELLRLGGCTGDAMQIVAGHIVHMFMLLRPALSAVDLVYAFVAEAASGVQLFS